MHDLPSHLVAYIGQGQTDVDNEPGRGMDGIDGNSMAGYDIANVY